MSRFFGGTTSNDELFVQAANFKLAGDFRTDWVSSHSTGGSEEN